MRPERSKTIDFSLPAKTPQQALEALQLSCARAERCLSDARRSLFRWRIPASEHPPVLEALVRDRFIDERRYAAAYVREKRQLSAWGPVKIVNGLKIKGIPEAVIREAMAEFGPNPSDTAPLAPLLRQRYERELRRSADSYALRGKLLRWAVGRGYSYDTAKAALEQISQSLPDDDV